MFITVQAGYKNFHRAGRLWRDLTSRRRSGQGQGIDEFLPHNRYQGSVAVICPACPEPGFNLPENWKDQLKDPEQRYAGHILICAGSDVMSDTSI